MSNVKKICLTPNLQNALLQEMFQEALDTDLGDFLTLLVGAAMLDLDAAPYGGARFPITSSMAGKPFGKFHLDPGVGDAVDEQSGLVNEQE